MWTPWEPVTAEIQGDHLAPVIWRDRLYLFWVTFMEKAVPDTRDIEIGPDSIYTFRASPVTKLEAQLHWSEYLKGAWSTRESGGIDVSSVVEIENLKINDINRIFIHASKEDKNGKERGVLIHLIVTSGSGSEVIGGFWPKHAFYLAGRNSSPMTTDVQFPPANPYPNTTTPSTTRYMGKGPLSVEFTQRITTSPGKAPVGSNTLPILSLISDHTLLPCNSSLALEVPKSAYEDAAKPAEVAKMLKDSLVETESLIKPVFLHDDTHTFFVEPNVVERTVEEWEPWLPLIQPFTTFEGLERLKWLEKHLQPYNPPLVEIPTPIPDWGDPLHGLEKVDWLVNPGTIIRFDDHLIGSLGQVPLTVEQVTQETLPGGVLVQVNTASAVGAADVAVLGGGLTLAQVGLAQPAGGIQIVGVGGVNEGLMHNVDQFAQNGFDAGVSGAIRQ